QVGTVAGTISDVYLREHNAKVEAFTETADLFQALVDKKIDAVLLVAPVLRYYATHEGKGLVQLVGREFNKDDLGVVFPSGSPLRKRVNDALLAMREDGTYRRIYDKWFGSED